MSAIILAMPETRVCSAHLACRILTEDIREALLVRNGEGTAEMPWCPGDLVGRWTDRIIGEPDRDRRTFIRYWIAAGEPVAFDAAHACMSVPVIRITGNRVDAILAEGQ